MNIVLPDGSVKELEEGATVADVAASIGAGLARAALAGIVDDTPVDLTPSSPTAIPWPSSPPRATRASGSCAIPRPIFWPPPSPICTPV